MRCLQNIKKCRGLVLSAAVVGTILMVRMPVTASDSDIVSVIIGEDAGNSLQTVSFTENWYETYNTFVGENGETIQLYVSDYDGGLYGIDVEKNGIIEASILFYSYSEQDDGGYLYYEDGIQWLTWYPTTYEIEVNYGDGNGAVRYTAVNAPVSDSDVVDMDNGAQSSSDETDDVGSTGVEFREDWFSIWSIFEDSASEAYFEVQYEETDAGTTMYVLNYGNDWEYLYLTATSDAYVETDDGGYKYYDIGSEHSVMVYYPGTNTLVLMVSESETYTCIAVETAYGVDPYGFATEDATWWDTTSYRCHMDIRYATGSSTGESYYEIKIEWSDGESDDNIWEIAHGTYDEASNAIIFSDCRYYTLTWYADGTEVETDVFTNGTGSLVMDGNHRLYWNDDEQDSGASCVFENASYSYKNLYEDFAGTWTYSYTDTVYGDPVPKTYTLEITETEDGSFDVIYHYWYDPSSETVAPEEDVYSISGAEYDSSTGITFYLPETYTFVKYDLSGNVYDKSTKKIEWYQNQAYTITSLDGMLTLSEVGEEIAWLSRAE